MTDLLRVLPHFPVGQFARLIRVLEHHEISTSDLLTLEAADIAKRTHQPLPDVTRFCRAVLDALHTDLGVSPPPPRPTPRQRPSEAGAEAGPEPEVPSRSPEAPEAPDDTNSPQAASTSALKDTAASLAAQWQTISTLDPSLDEALGGGIPAGYVTEITGESGAGKTQFLLSLLLAVQLPPPHGLGRPALYISTEAPLSTRRLAQMLAANPLFQRLPPAERPSLDNIISTATPDLESQDHILTFQVPVEVERRGIGLIVLDSVAANYRAEFERSSAATGRQGFNMGARTAELVKLGMHLRDLAQRHNLAVVVANQVADRFTPLTTTTTTITTTTATSSLTRTPASSLHHHHHHQNTQQHTNQTQSSPLASRSHNNNNNSPHSHPHPHSPPSSTSHPSLTLDHQQRWFTGWGDDPSPSAQHALKTPSLGLVWTTQIAARIALLKRRPAHTLLLPHHYHQTQVQTHTQGGVGLGLGLGSGTGTGTGTGTVSGSGGTNSSWKRWMKVVFAPHVGPSGMGLDGAVGFEVWMGGLRGVGGLVGPQVVGSQIGKGAVVGDREGDDDEDGR